MTRIIPRLLQLMVVVVIVWVAATPAAACGCGAYIPREGDAHVTQERALIRWDGQTEDIVMALSVAGESDEAAWILPVPARATAQLADPDLFDALQELTKPLIREEVVYTDGMTAGAPPPGGGVTVLERQTLGPFDVSTLAATDANALSDWLSTNGYQFPADLAGALQPYVAQDWFYVALRLTPGQDQQALTGTLDPIWVTFESSEVIYPMRLSALAQAELPVYLYVLADHRVAEPDTNATAVRNRVSYAQWLDPATLPADSPIAPFVPRKLFLTKYETTITQPETITEDFIFPFAATDELYHETQVRYVYVEMGPVERILRMPLVTLALALIIVVALILFYRRRRPPRTTTS